MAIFSSSNIELESVKTDANTTIITAGARIKGELELTCNLYVDGELEGVINSQKDVNIGKNGKVKGTIKTNRLVVQGNLEGNVDANRVEIKASGRIQGEVIATELIIESKGIFEGTSSIKDAQSSPLSIES